MAGRRAFKVSAAAVLLAFAAAGYAAAAQPKPVKTRVLTGKERMQGKWADPQRVNDCKVPVKKRGDSKRPDDCSHVKPAPGGQASQ
ncbi:MAG: hypothetical protein ACR2PM_17250 [Hyphomicrobiales bacterium]